jgi:ABC-2 type transport system permease protein
MSKISLIIKREYLTRVKKKSFIVMSIIGPLLFAGMFVLPAWFSSMEDTSSKHIAVIDHVGKYSEAISSTEYVKFDFLSNTAEEQLRGSYKEKGYDAYLVISADLQEDPSAAKIYSDAQITIDLKEGIARDLKRFLEQERLESYQIEGLADIIKNVRNTKVEISTIKLGEDGTEKESSVEITIAISFIFAMLVYFFVLMYGTQVMRGVMEEKTNRIVEVIISSVRPFELMMGKIVGIALVALTQFLLWVVFTLVIVFGVKTAIGSDTAMTQTATQQIEMVQGAGGSAMMEKAGSEEFQKQFTSILEKVEAANLLGVLFAFAFLFLFGYLLYAALFAAVGSAIDNETDSQQFVMPIMMPLILSIYIAMVAFRNPTGDVAFWFSMIPFTSPVVMMARIPYQIPTWEIILSMAILAGSFVLMTWIAGRVYRVGILMYGKKVTYKELWKWFRQAGK